MKTKLYPNYCNYYYYDEGDDTILLVRKVGGEEVYRHWMKFGSIDEAKTYFEDEI